MTMIRLLSAALLLTSLVAPVEAQVATSSDPMLNIAIHDINGSAPEAAGQRVLRAAQRRARSRRSETSVSVARDTWLLLMKAAVHLARVELTPGDVNGMLRSWDDHMGEFVRRQGDLLRTRPLGSGVCADLEVNLLLQASHFVSRARDGLLASIHGEDVDGRADMLRSLALVRLAADEAAELGQSGLSCEALPYAAEGAMLSAEQRQMLTGAASAVVALQGAAGFEVLTEARH